MTTEFVYKEFRNLDGVRVLKFRENDEKFQILKSSIHRPRQHDEVFDAESASEALIVSNLEDVRVESFVSGDEPNYLISGWSSEVDYPREDLEFILAGEGYFLGLQEQP